MIKTQIHAEIVGHSLSPQGDELISVLCTFPRIILAEVNTHRMLSKNTSSSRAIPFNKMVEAVQNNPFIPIAWQKEHTGMQGSEYITNPTMISKRTNDWLDGMTFMIEKAKQMNSNIDFVDDLKDKEGVTKQLCNRLLEPFMWTTMLITGSKEGWNNFFELRNPVYEVGHNTFKSKKEVLDYYSDDPNFPELRRYSDLDWLKINKGQAEIHMMALAESIYDAVNESTPKQLQAGQWHIPFEDKITEKSVDSYLKGVMDIRKDGLWGNELIQKTKVEISTSMAARTSYTVVGEEKDIDYKKMIELHDRLLSQDPPHSSPLEHCARAMSDEEYECFLKGEREINKNANHWSDVEYFYDYNKIFGWCNNLKGFIPYRYFIDNNLI